MTGEWKETNRIEVNGTGPCFYMDFPPIKLIYKRGLQTPWNPFVRTVIFIIVLFKTLTWFFHWVVTLLETHTLCFHSMNYRGLSRPQTRAERRRQVKSTSVKDGAAVKQLFVPGEVWGNFSFRVSYRTEWLLKELCVWSYFFKKKVNESKSNKLKRQFCPIFFCKTITAVKCRSLGTPGQTTRFILKTRSPFKEVKARRKKDRYWGCLTIT